MKSRVQRVERGDVGVLREDGEFEAVGRIPGRSGRRDQPDVHVLLREERADRALEQQQQVGVLLEGVVQGHAHVDAQRGGERRDGVHALGLLALRLLRRPAQRRVLPLLLPQLLVGVEERLVGCVAARGGRDEAGVGVGGEGEDDGEGLEEAVVVVVDVVHGEGAPEEVAGVSGVEVEEEEALCVGEEAFLVEGLDGELQAAPF